jgi:hypothetical protein
MLARAEKAFDPQIASSYLELSAQWLRLAEQAQSAAEVIDRSNSSDTPDDRLN